jgi:hypothetical protein
MGVDKTRGKRTSGAIDLFVVGKSLPQLGVRCHCVDPVADHTHPPSASWGLAWPVDQKIW